MKTEKSASCVPSLSLHICVPAKPEAGEDSSMYCYGASASVLGVFDGCGGAGSQHHQLYENHTEAYMASRFCAGAFYDSFQDLFPAEGTPEELLQRYLSLTTERCGVTLSTFRPPEADSRVKGSMVRVLPSTAAVVLVLPEKDGKYQAAAIWAGDSRCYVLDDYGLAQLTVDDTTVADPMENLYEDGVLKNIIHDGKALSLHVGVFTFKPPFCVLCATDGCFGYFTTPMEFEGALLQSLLASKPPAAWEELVSKIMGKVAGDDYTLCLAAYGFKDFRAMQKYFLLRTRFLTETYLTELRQLPKAQREARQEMWSSYRTDYMRYIEGNT